MWTLAVVEIAGKQYTITPDQEIDVNSLGEVSTLTCDKVLMLLDGDKVKLGDPYLKETLVFDVVANKRGRKIRVATFHAKANTRRIKGSRLHSSKVKLASKTETKAVKTT